LKQLIVNADDLGASSGINRGIVEAHTDGIVTSASYMVYGRAADEAVVLAREHPGLAIGLHWDVWGEGEREFDLRDVAAARDEFHRQLELFEKRFERLPTHLDSHQHAHRHEPVRELFRELAAEHQLLLRQESPVRYVGGFYAQWEWGVTDLEHVSVAFLEGLLREEIEEGWTELGCHPGDWCDDFESIYHTHTEREAELRTLTDPRIAATLDAEGIRLRSFADFRTDAA
jgi:predicted glycoside hydrolase/deacetylase ChbG (UPF0249 family)